MPYIDSSAVPATQGKLTSLPQSVKVNTDETALFAGINLRSHPHGDAVTAKVMSDCRWRRDPTSKPFDRRHMFWGSAEPIVPVLTSL